MGDYTKLTLCAKPAPSCSGEVQQALAAAKPGRAQELPMHELFKCARWQTLISQGRIIVADDGPIFQIEGQGKNYDQEIRKLCDWLSCFLSSEEEGNLVGALSNPPKLGHFSNFSDSLPCAASGQTSAVSKVFRDGDRSA